MRACVCAWGWLTLSVVNYNGQTCCYKLCLVGLSLVVGSFGRPFGQLVNFEIHLRLFARHQICIKRSLYLSFSLALCALTRNWSVDPPRASWVGACRMPAVVVAADPADAAANCGYETNLYVVAPGTPGRAIDDVNWWAYSQRTRNCPLCRCLSLQRDKEIYECIFGFLFVCVKCKYVFKLLD